MMQFLAEAHWVPLRVLPDTSIRPTPSVCPVESTTSALSSTSSTDTPEVASDCCWSVDKVAACTVEDESILVHSTGGRGYGLGGTSLSAGRHVWKVEILNEARGNEGTCVGVSVWPVSDYSHRTTRDMWLYRAYSGNIYHNGEIQGKTLPQFTQDDAITCILDMDARTLSFAKNDEQPVLAFDDIPADIELYPCVTFYSSSPGEKVRITSMVMQGAQRDFGKFFIVHDSRSVYRQYRLRPVFR